MQSRHIINTAYVPSTNKSDTTNYRGNWNHFKIIQKMPEQHTRQARYEETTENSNIGQFKHTSKSVVAKVRNI